MKVALSSLCLGLALLGSTAHAGIVWLPNQEIPIPNTFEGVSIDLETGATSTDRDGLTGGDLNFILGGTGFTNDADRLAGTPSLQPVRVGTNNTDALRNLGVGTVVDQNTASFSTGFGSSGDASSHFDTEFVSGTPGYIGFSLTLPNNTVAYGWASVTLQDNNGAGGVVHSWAFEDSGASIMVGQVPEPTAPLLSLIALAPLLWRRKR